MDNSSPSSSTQTSHHSSSSHNSLDVSTYKILHPGSIPSRPRSILHLLSDRSHRSSTARPPSRHPTLTHELTSFVEHSAVVNFRASYLHHLNGIDPPAETPTDHRWLRQHRRRNPSPTRPSPAVSTISLAFANDGRTLASTHGDHSVKITCAHTGRLIRSLEGHPRTPWTVKYHPVEDRIVVSGCLGFQVRVWDWNYRREGRSPRVERRWRRRYFTVPGEEWGIPKEDPGWYEVLAQEYDYSEGVGVCLNMIRFNHAIISLSFHPQGEVLAVACGSTLHLWDYDEETRKKRGNEGEVGPRGRTMDFRHENALRCVHFPPGGRTLIVGGVNPPSANEGLATRGHRPRGGMSGGGLSFHLRLWDFNVDAVLNPVVEDLNMESNLGGVVSDDGDVIWNYSVVEKPLSDPRIIIPRVLLYNDGGFDLSKDGRILCACAEYWLPQGIHNAMELLLSLKQNNEEDMTRDDDYNNSTQEQGSRPSSPLLQGADVLAASPVQMSSPSHPRTPPHNIFTTSLSPPPPPGNRNLPRIYNSSLGLGANLISTSTHNPHPLSLVAPTHPAYENEGGRYVPHVVTISMDTSPPLRNTGPRINLTKPFVETESMRRQPKLGQLLNAAPLDGTKASGVTCVKLSPSSEYCLLGYGVRENLPSVNGNDPCHPVTALYNVDMGMLHVSTLTSASDDVNIARFHPESGHGFVYGTKQGRVRILSTRPWSEHHS